MKNRFAGLIEFIDHVLERYDGDNDTIPGAPVITWADAQLLETMKRMVIETADLQRRIETLEEKNGGR